MVVVAGFEKRSAGTRSSIVSIALAAALGKHACHLHNGTVFRVGARIYRISCYYPRTLVTEDKSDPSSFFSFLLSFLFLFLVILSATHKIAHSYAL